MVDHRDILSPDLFSHGSRSSNSRSDLLKLPNVGCPIHPARVYSWTMQGGLKMLSMTPCESNRVVVPHELSEVCCHVLRTTKVHVSLFHRSWLLIVRMDAVRIESNCKVPWMNRSRCSGVSWKFRCISLGKSKSKQKRPTLCNFFLKTEKTDLKKS